MIIMRYSIFAARNHFFLFHVAKLFLIEYINFARNLIIKDGMKLWQLFVSEIFTHTHEI